MNIQGGLKKTELCNKTTKSQVNWI